MSSRPRSVRGAAVWAMSSQYAAFAINFAASIYLARTWIGPDELGLFSIAFAAASLVSVLQDFGLTRFIAGEAQIDDAKLRTAFSLSVVIAGVIAAVSVALAWPMAALYAMPALVPVMLVIGASYLLVPLAIVPTALRQRALDFRSNTMIEVGAALANAGVSILLAREGIGALALAWGAFAQQAARATISQWRNGFLFPWPLRFSGAGPILRFGGGTSVLTLLWSLNVRAPELLVGRLIDNLAVGLFARANGLAGQLRVLVSGAVTSVFYPAFARVRDSGEPLAPPYLRVISAYSAVTWPAMAGLAVLASPLIDLLYGERWLGSAGLLRWIALSQILFTALPLHSELPMLLGRMPGLVRRAIVENVASLVLLVAAALVSLEWVAISRLAYGAIWLAVYAGFIRHLVGFGWGELARVWMKSAIATLMAVAPAAAALAVWPAASPMNLAAMLCATAAGAACWLATLIAVRHPACREIDGLLAPLRRWTWARIGG